MKFINIFAVTLLIFSACSSKREYFKPTQEVQKIKTTKSDNILYSDKYLANTKNKIILDGMSINFDFKKDEKVINAYDNMVITSNKEGLLKIYEDNKEIYQNKFENKIVGASKKEDLLALISSSDTLYLIDTKNKKIIFEHSGDISHSVDNRIALPKFYNNLVFFPSLNGKIYIVKEDGKLLNDIIVSSDSYFNNIIFLDVFENKLVAATAKKILMLQGEKELKINKDIKIVLRDENNFYIFTKDGYLEKYDLNFKKINDKYFKFAIFTDAIISKNKIFIIEKNSYLLKLSKDFESVEIYKLNQKAKKSFITKDGFYYDGEFIDFK